VTLSVADLVAQVLQRHGVQHIFGQSLPSELLLAAERIGIRQVFYRTENAGGAMADGYARVSGRIGVVAGQNGPAATLLVPPMAEAIKASIPLLALVQEVPREQRARNAFQEFDHRLLFASCAKAVVALDDAGRMEDEIENAIVLATSGRPGPVALLLPKDVLSQPAPARVSRRDGLGCFPLDRPRPEKAGIRQAAEILSSAKRPLVIAGGGVHLSGACLQLARLQEAASLPVATTTMGKGSVDESHELSVGVVGSIMGERSLTSGQRQLVREADAVLLVGTRTNENGTDAWRLMSEDAQFIHLDIAPDEVGRNYNSLRLVGDARSGLEDLLDTMRRADLSVRASSRGGVAAGIRAARAAARPRADEVRNSDAAPIRPERVMKELDALLPSTGIVVADASYSTIWSAAYLSSRRAGQRFVSPRGLAGLGWGLPMALGAKVANPDVPVVCLAGDGAFGHTWQELETATREGIAVTVILLNNGILGFQKHAELHTFGTHTTAIAFAAVDHVAIARACGVTAVRIEDPSQLAQALGAAIGSERSTLIEVMTDPNAYPPITAWNGSEALAPEPVPVHG
jgi:acetolactate synthase-1/2/3 large subunit